MELSPQAITGVEFTQVRKGYDPEEVKSFLARLAAGLEEMRSHLVASDARARAAMARVQELSSREAPVASGDTEVISKALLVAQRAADAHLADAQKTADTLVTGADSHAKSLLADAEARSTETIRQAELQAKTHRETELRAVNDHKVALQSEVEVLNERIVAERERVAAVIESLQRLLRSPEGLGTLAYRPTSTTSAATAPILPPVATTPVDEEHEMASTPVRVAVGDEPVESDDSVTGEALTLNPWKVD